MYVAESMVKWDSMKTSLVLEVESALPLFVVPSPTLPVSKELSIIVYFSESMVVIDLSAKNEQRSVYHGKMKYLDEFLLFKLVLEQRMMSQIFRIYARN